MVFWEGYVSDDVMGTFAPIVVYWLYAGFYQLLPRLDRYRLHTKKEEEQKNLVMLSTVVKGVLLQQLVQATVAQVLFLVTAQASLLGVPVQPSIPVQILQVFMAMLVMDTWQYFVHRYMHHNKFLYVIFTPSITAWLFLTRLEHSTTTHWRVSSSTPLAVPCRS